MLSGPHIEAEIRYLTAAEGGRSSAVHTGYRGQFHYDDDDHIWDAPQTFVGKDWVEPGETITALISFMSPVEHHGRVFVGMKFHVQEGARVVGRGIVTKVFPRLAEDATQGNAT